MSNPELYQDAQAILNVVVDAFLDSAVALPERQYVSDGSIAIDCEQLTVTIVQVYRGLPGEIQTDPMGPRRCATVSSFECAIILVRCVPTLKESSAGQIVFPTVHELDSSAQTILQDGAILWRGLMAAWAEGTLVPGCDQLALGPMISLGPEGGFAGWTVSLEAQF